MRETRLSKFLIILIILFSNYVYCQNFKTIHSFNFGSILNTKILKDSTEFKGYLIFECPQKYNDKIEIDFKDFFKCNFYFVENLKDISNENNRIWFDSFRILMDAFSFDCSGDPELYKSNIDFLDFYEQYKSFYKKNITYAPFLFDFLTTEIFFKDVHPWLKSQNDSISYFIFSLSFIGTEFEMERDFNTRKMSPENIITKKLNFMFPISKSCDFQPTQESFLIANNFIRLASVPEYLFNEK